MNPVERIVAINRLLKRRIPPSKDTLMNELEVSWATLKRDIEMMRNRLNAPIIWDREARGYRYDPNQSEFELPGMWLSAGEVESLLIVQNLIGQLQQGFLHDQLSGFQEKLERMTPWPGRAAGRIVLRGTAIRRVSPKHFEVIAQATLERKRLEIDYFGRHKARNSSRTVSPQRLVFYRGTWYLDAWCHASEAWRRFALDSVHECRLLAVQAKDCDLSELEDAYGIYSGPKSHWAEILFDAVAARWVTAEQWHPRQEQTLYEDGSLLLRVPYGHPQEILMDILRHGPHAEVLAPASLRSDLTAALELALLRYQRKQPASARPGVRKAQAG